MPRERAAPSSGVKMRTRDVAAALGGGSTKTVSEKFISLASGCSVLLGQLARVREDGELVPGERPVGEDVGDDVAKGRHAPTLPAQQ